ncbi:ABC transporter substrate-binding protein [Candidatus Falkowbacteria bacterium CG10_big_fil_rev_8_21_14_0_10_37_18]|uniref:ABC transporter substrate-binding protein n=1 Tax=Candidatus Falkowbacteria bacterium CG10_big_fil_rev_8_21_14_0_10_37_18 TaxID=1974562 RepID=A0A2H0V9K1_9BACT|nr:MAG: ABC transporter substrate-binding protein [Candidatus Falkowbacteria bacterium CG10_big_fil_rev_8_21_14_0_10_37_18]
MFKKSFIVRLSLLILLGVGFVLLFIFLKPQVSNPTAGPEQTAKLRVATSFYPLYFLAQEIGGEQAVVTNVTPAGAEPHDYEPTPRDIAAITNSRLLILNGLGLEPWENSIKSNINPAQTKIIVMGDELPVSELKSHKSHDFDPHVWLSPILVTQMLDKITAGFIEADPENESYYQTQAVELKKKLSDLNSAYVNGLSNCQKQDIVTAHAAFAYLADAYNFQQIAIAGLSPEVEPSPGQMINIVKLVREHQIKYIFFESLVSPKLSNTIAAETGVATLVLNPIEGLTPEELKSGKNYFTEMENNLINLQTALECQM